MKTNLVCTIRTAMQSFLMLIMTLLASVVAYAQETKEVDVDINAEGGDFFASPWVWVVGVAVFILLLVALMRGGGSRRDV